MQSLRQGSGLEYPRASSFLVGLGVGFEEKISDSDLIDFKCSQWLKTLFISRLPDIPGDIQLENDIEFKFEVYEKVAGEKVHACIYELEHMRKCMHTCT